MTANPFEEPGRVVTGERLVGREDRVVALARELESNCYVLTGQPRIGKTSLVREATNRIKVHRPQVPVVAHSLQKVTSARQLMGWIIGDLRREVQRCNADVAGLVGWGDLLDDVNRDEVRAMDICVRDLVTAWPDLHWILVLDEMDAVRDLEGRKQLLGWLRDVLTDRDRYHCSCVIITRRRLRRIEEQALCGSTLADTREGEFLAPLDRVGIAQMAARLEWGELSEDDMDTVWDLTGGHPFLAERLFQEAWSVGAIDAALPTVRARYFEYYEHVRRILEEDELLANLLRSVVPPLKEVPEVDLTCLEGYGLLVQVEEEVEEDGKTVKVLRNRAWSAHFQQYLERLWRQTPLWETWQRTEQALRDLIEQTLSEELGEDWATIVSGRHAHIDKAFKVCRKLAEREQRDLGLGERGRDLDYAYPDDLWDIIEANWQYFNDVFGMGRKIKQQWKDKLWAIGRVRNPYAHNRPERVPEREVRTALVFCEDILKAIDKAGKGTVIPTDH